MTMQRRKQACVGGQADRIVGDMCVPVVYSGRHRGTEEETPSMFNAA